MERTDDCMLGLSRLQGRESYAMDVLGQIGARRGTVLNILGGRGSRADVRGDLHGGPSCYTMGARRDRVKGS